MAAPNTPESDEDKGPVSGAPDHADEGSAPVATTVNVGSGRMHVGPSASGYRPSVTSLWMPVVRDGDEATGSVVGAPRVRVVTPPPATSAAPMASPPRRPSSPPGGGAPPDAARTSPEGDDLPSPIDDAHERNASPHTGRVPFRVGNYEVATRIAQGGVGSIYVCRKADASEPHLFVLKVVRQHASRADAAAESFRQEARVGALLQHPNAQTVVDRGMYENQPFLILDYIEGVSLSDLLAGEPRPTPAMVAAILLDVLAALEAAHRVVDRAGAPMGLVHGDVSAENILVGIDGRARLTDFGSSRFIAAGEPAARRPFALAKPAAMSPEQFRGDALDARSDIFSVGVALWISLTGQSLFAAPTYEQTMMNVMRKKVVPPSHLGAPDAFDDVCMQALSRWPEGRYQSAGEMAAALRRAATAAGLLETREGVGRWVRRGMGDALAEQRRRIDYMFGSDSGGTPPPIVERAPGPTTASRSRPLGTGPKRQEWARTQVISTSDIKLALGSRAHLASLERGHPADLAEPADANDEGTDATLVLSRLSPRQRRLVVGLSMAVFVGTVVVGLVLTRKPASGIAAAASSSTATATAPSALPRP